MRCEEFEAELSEYIEGELSPEKTTRVEKHVLHCPACSDTLRGVYQVRLALHGLGEINPSALFKLRLSSRLQEKVVRKQQFRSRSLAWGLAFAAALAILLWPDQDEEVAEHLSWEKQELLISRPRGRVWIESLPKLSYPGPYSHAHVRTVSF